MVEMVVVTMVTILFFHCNPNQKDATSCAINLGRIIQTIICYLYPVLTAGLLIFIELFYRSICSLIIFYIDKLNLVIYKDNTIVKRNIFMKD